jgi:hypothetical protein
MRSVQPEPALMPAESTPAPGHSPGWYAIRVGYGILCGLAFALWALVILQQGWRAYVARVDFIGPYIGGYLVGTGQGAHLYDLDVQQRIQLQLIAPYRPVVPLYYEYPAWTALLFAPLALLPLGGAFLLWSGANLALAGATIRRLVAATARLRADRALLVIAILGFLPLTLTLWQGQLAIPVWLGLTGAVLAWRSGHERQAGAWLILGLLKPQLIALPVLALLVGRRWRALAVVLAGSAAVLGGSLLVLGNWLPAYVSFLTTFVRPDLALGDNPLLIQNWRGLVYHLLGTTGGPAADGLVLALDALSVAGVVALCWPRAGRDSAGWELRFAVAILLGLLVDPHLLLHDTLVALVPGFIFWRAATGAGARRGTLRGVLAAGPFVAFLAEFWTPTRIQLGAWYLVLLLGAVAWAWRDLAAPEEAV